MPDKSYRIQLESVSNLLNTLGVEAQPYTSVAPPPPPRVVHPRKFSIDMGRDEMISGFGRIEEEPEDDHVAHGQQVLSSIGSRNAPH